MSSLSPENQPSSLPPDLTTLVLILFYVGGVDSMIAEKRGKGSHTKRAIDVAKDGSIDCFFREKNCTRFYRITEPYFDCF